MAHLRAVSSSSLATVFHGSAAVLWIAAGCDGVIHGASDALLARLGFSADDLASGELTLASLGFGAEPPTPESPPRVRTLLGRDGRRCALLLAVLPPASLPQESLPTASLPQESLPSAAGVRIVAMPVPDELEQLQGLRQQVQLLEQANEALRTYAFALAHDLASPLRGLQLLCQWIQEELPEPPPRLADLLHHLTDRSRRLQSFVQGSLHEATRRGGDRAVDLDALVRDTFDLLGADPRRVVLVTRDLPTLRTQRFTLEQIFLNLLANALHHGGAERLTIEVSAAETDGGYELVVRDDGDGIDGPTRERLTLAMDGRATAWLGGLGLAIVYRAVTARGGRVWLGDGERGTAVHFTWPREG